MIALRRLAALTWICVAPLGCTLGSGGESESDGGSSSTTNGETGELDPGCACITDEEDLSPPMCGDLLCPLVDVTCEDNDGPRGYAACRGNSATLVVANPDALTCALEALRDRSEGVVQWASNQADMLSDYGYVAIKADGRGISRTSYRHDLDYGQSDAVLGELDPTTTFEACLNADDEATRFFCLVDALAEESLAICDAAWMGDATARLSDPALEWGTAPPSRTQERD